MAGRPEKNSARLRHALSAVYASDTRSGSREFQASSAARALTAAVSRVNGGNGGRPCAGVAIKPSEVLGEREPDGARSVGHDGRLQSAQRRLGHREGRRTGARDRRMVDGTFRIPRDLGAFVEGVLDEQLQSPALVVDARGEVDDAERRLLA